MRFAGLAGLGLLASVAALSGQQSPSFRVGVELVTVPVTVESRERNRAVPTLAASDFRLYEDGQEQHVTVAGIDRRPVSLAIALDSSGSMAGERRELAAAALRALFVLLDPRDELSLVAFAGDVVVPMTWARVGQMPGLEWPQWVVPPTRTALLDAVMQGLSLMDAATESRHVLLVVSDGFEWHSTATWPDLVKTRRQSETEVYAFRTLPWRDRKQEDRVGTLDGVRAMPRLDAMGALVGDSGGIVHEVGTGEETALATMAFTSTLRNQYLLAYETPRPLDGTYRRIKVEARGHDVRVRHRGGYLALPAPK